MAWDDEGCFVGGDELSIIVPAVRDLFYLEGEKSFLIGPANLGYYTSPRKLAELLWRNGIRA